MSVVEVRVLGSGPFREIGVPRAVGTTPAGDLVVVGGDLGSVQWHGHDASARSRPHQGWYPLAVYRSAGLELLHHGTTHWAANAIACHPTLPLAVVGTGSYDGGWFYEGELLLLNLVTGSITSLLDYPREVRKLAWRDERTLDLVLAVPCDADEEELGTTSMACSIRRDDWSSVAEVSPYPATPIPDEPRTDAAPAVAAVEKLCAERGPHWTVRCRVRAVEALPDGRILAALDGVRLECWSATSAEPLWQLAAEGNGCQIKSMPDGRTALALTQAPSRFEDRRWTSCPSVVAEVDLAEGIVEATHEPEFSAVLVTRADGRWVLRDSEDTGRVVGAVTAEIGRYDLINHFFDIRYAPDLLFLQGRADKSWKDKWVVTVDPRDGSVRRLFALEWDRSRDGHLFGGCGAYLDDLSGPAIVHAGAVHNGAGLLPGNAFVARRVYPSGELQWVFTMDNHATALDADAEFVYVTLSSGELIVLRAVDGSVRFRQELRVGGHPVIALSLSRMGADHLVAGTLDGRVVVFATG